MNAIICESWICLLWKIAREAVPFNVWSPCDGTPQHMRCDLDKLGFASMRIICEGQPDIWLIHLLQKSQWHVVSPLHLTKCGRSAHTALLDFSCPRLCSSTILLLFCGFTFRWYLSWIKFFMAISTISPWWGRKPAHTFVLASWVRHVNFTITVCGISCWWKNEENDSVVIEVPCPGPLLSLLHTLGKPLAS